MSGEVFEAGALAWRLQVVGDEIFTQKVKGADQSVDQLGRTSRTTSTLLEQSGQKARDNADRYKQLAQRSNEAQAAASRIGPVFLGAGLAVAAGIALAIAKFGEYDKALDSLGANSGEEGAKLAELGEAAIDAGRDFGYTATEAISAEEALAKAGVSTSDILGGSLVGSLTLAAAGTIGVADAAEVAAIAMTQFKKDGKDVPHIADLIAAGAGKAVGDVSDMAMALKQGGLVSSQFGISLEETVGTLSAFAAAGLIGSDAGTSYKTMLLSLAAPQGRAKELMKELGIETYDASGKFIGITGLAGVLRDKLSGLTDQQRQAALSTIFGTDAIRAASVLYDEGADGIQEWTDKVNDTGYAAEQARLKLDNLSGDVGKLGSSFDNALIKSGSTANDVLRDMVQSLIELVDWYAELDPSTQGAALAIGVGTGALLLMFGAIFTLVPKINDFRVALDALNLKMGRTAVVGGAVGLALAAIAAVLSAVAGANADAAAKTESYGNTLDAVTNKITKSTRELAKTNLAAKDSFAFLEGRSAYDNAERLGIDLDLVTDAALGNVEALRALRDATEIAGIGQGELDQRVKDSGLTLLDYSSAATDLTQSVIGESASIEEAIRVAEQKSSVDGDSVDSNVEVKDSYLEVTDAVDGVTTSLQDLAKELDAANGKSLDAREAARQLEAAYDDVDAALQEQKDAYIEANGNLDGFTANMDITTEAGRTLQGKLDDVARAAMDSGQAIIDSGGSYEEYRASLEASRDQILTRINDLGITGDAATDLADKILMIPSEREWKMFADTAAAEAAIIRVQNLIKGVSSSGQVTYKISTGAGNRFEADGGMLSFFAAGGYSGGEHHVAQIARAGTVRVWAEPETGGEAYIPLAPAKRPRSTAILSEVADSFGFDLVPRGTQQFSNGAVVPTPGTPTAPANAGIAPVDLSQRTINQLARALAPFMRNQGRNGGATDA